MCTPLYAPATDFCFKDKDKVGDYCWSTVGYYWLGYGNWEITEDDHGNNNCGVMCTACYPCKLFNGKSNCSDCNQLQSYFSHLVQAGLL